LIDPGIIEQQGMGLRGPRAWRVTHVLKISKATEGTCKAIWEVKTQQTPAELSGITCEPHQETTKTAHKQQGGLEQASRGDTPTCCTGKSVVEVLVLTMSKALQDINHCKGRCNHLNWPLQLSHLTPQTLHVGRLLVTLLHTQW
jgi:hypothetical protein